LNGLWLLYVTEWWVKCHKNRSPIGQAKHEFSRLGVLNSSSQIVLVCKLKK